MSPPLPLVGNIIAVDTSGEQGLLCKIRRVAGKQMKLIQRSTKCGKDVAKAGWPIASEEYLISRSPGATAAVAAASEAESPQSACTQTIIFNIYGNANAQTVPHSVAPLHSLHPVALPTS